MVFSVMLVAPLGAACWNGSLTLRGLGQGPLDPVLKFMVVAVTVYGMATPRGPMLSIKSEPPCTTPIGTIAHVHTGRLAGTDSSSSDALLAGAPPVEDAVVFPWKLANWHLLPRPVGIMFYAIPMYWAGRDPGPDGKQFTPDGFHARTSSRR